MKEMIEYRKQIVRRLDQVMEGLPGAPEHFPPEAWGVVDASGESLSSRVERFCRVEQGIYFAMIEAFLSGQARGAESNLPWRTPELLERDGPSAAVGQIQLHSRSIIARLEDLPVEDWNTRLRHPQQGLRTLQWWVEQSLAYANRQLPGVFSTFQIESGA